jgi:hypothetical protein
LGVRGKPVRNGSTPAPLCAGSRFSAPTQPAKGIAPTCPHLQSLRPLEVVHQQGLIMKCGGFRAVTAQRAASVFAHADGGGQALALKTSTHDGAVGRAPRF